MFLYISVSSARAVVYLIDASGGEPRPIEISPSLPARVPEFQTPTATADGFTVKVTNYDTNWNWSVNTTRGSATRSAGLITVTGLAPGESAAVTVDATRTGYNAGTAGVSGSAETGLALTFTLETPTATADGFTVKVTNYDTNWNWSVNTTRGSATRSAGLITVTGLAPGESAAVTVDATRTGYNAGTAGVSGSAETGLALTFTLETPTATADGFTVKVTNYDTNWNWSVNTTRGSATRSAGLITVTGLAPGESAAVTVDATRTGYNAGTAGVSGTAAAAVAVPSLPVWGVAALSGMLMILVKKLNKK